MPGPRYSRLHALYYINRNQVNITGISGLCIERLRCDIFNIRFSVRVFIRASAFWNNLWDLQVPLDRQREVLWFKDRLFDLLMIYGYGMSVWIAVSVSLAYLGTSI
jgi:hypothetical protein